MYMYVSRENLIFCKYKKIKRFYELELFSFYLDWLTEKNYEIFVSWLSNYLGFQHKSLQLALVGVKWR